MLQPGLHIRIPFVDEWRTVRSAAERFSFESSALTADHQSVSLVGELRFAVRRPTDFLSAEAALRSGLAALCESAVGELFSLHDLDQLMLKREQLRGDLVMALEDRLGFAGVSIEDVQIVSLRPERRIGRIRAERTLLSHHYEVVRDRLAIEREVRKVMSQARAQELRDVHEAARDFDAMTLDVLRLELIREASAAAGSSAPGSTGGLDEARYRR